MKPPKPPDVVQRVANPTHYLKIPGSDLNLPTVYQSNFYRVLKPSHWTLQWLQFLWRHVYTVVEAHWRFYRKRWIDETGLWWKVRIWYIRFWFAFGHPEELTFQEHLISSSLLELGLCFFVSLPSCFGHGLPFSSLWYWSWLIFIIPSYIPDK